jgi:uncharacterized metal-binding protein YceD (DUF177 family)
MKNPHQEFEFSRPLELSRIGATELRETIAADPAEREALARRFGLPALTRLSAELRIRRVGRDVVRLDGDLVAEVTQSCVVTLSPVESRIAESFTQLYAPPVEALETEVVIDVEAEDPPETLHGEVLDLGEAVVQQLAVALDPYPRAPGARLESVGADAASGASGPFAALAALKRQG